MTTERSTVKVEVTRIEEREGCLLLSNGQRLPVEARYLQKVNVLTGDTLFLEQDGEKLKATVARPQQWKGEITFHGGKAIDAKGLPKALD